MVCLSSIILHRIVDWMDTVNKPTQDNTELRQQILTEFKQVLKLAPADYTENCTNVVMSILAAQKSALIDKLIEGADNLYIPSEHDVYIEEQHDRPHNVVYLHQVKVLAEKLRGTE